MTVMYYRSGALRATCATGARGTEHSGKKPGAHEAACVTESSPRKLPTPSEWPLTKPNVDRNLRKYINTTNE